MRSAARATSATRGRVEGSVSKHRPTSALQQQRKAASDGPPGEQHSTCLCALLSSHATRLEGMSVETMGQRASGKPTGSQATRCLWRPPDALWQLCSLCWPAQPAAAPRDQGERTSDGR